MQPLDFDGAANALESYFKKLASLLGLAAAHTILGVAHTCLLKLKVLRRPMPHTIESLIAISITISGVSFADEKLEEWRKFSQWSAKKLASGQALWIMALPSAYELKEVADVPPATLKSLIGE